MITKEKEIVTHLERIYGPRPFLREAAELICLERGFYPDVVQNMLNTGRLSDSGGGRMALRPDPVR